MNVPRTFNEMSLSMIMHERGENDKLGLSLYKNIIIGTYS